MTSEYFKTALGSAPFRAELHHLLWTKPFMNGGLRDEGWFCREHALFVAVLGMLRGFSAAVIEGRAEFCVGPTADADPSGIGQDPHWWVRFDGIGSCDLSVRLDNFAGGARWVGWVDSYLLGGRFYPDGTTEFTSLSDPTKHQQACAIATHQVDHRSAHYLQRRGERIGLHQIENARKWCNSQLTDLLKRSFPARTDIYAKAILHLDEIMNGAGQSLTHLPRMAAWGSIAKRPGNGRIDLVERIKAIPGCY